MKAVVFHAVGDIRLEEVPEPKLKEGRIPGHEGVGIVEQLGPMVRNLSAGDRVIIPSTIACRRKKPAYRGRT